MGGTTEERASELVHTPIITEYDAKAVLSDPTFAEQSSRF